jgi:hypothetical protein
VIGAVVVVQAGTQAQPADQVLDLAVVETLTLAGRAETLEGELSGDRGVPQALIGQSPDPIRERRVVRQLVDPGYRADQVGTGLVAAGPGHGGVHALGGLVGGDLDRLDDGAQQPLTVGHGGRRRAHSAGMSSARARIAASSAADNRAGRCRWYRWYSSPRLARSASAASHSRSSWRATSSGRAAGTRSRRWYGRA